MSKKIKKIAGIAAVATGVAFAGFSLLAKCKKGDAVYNDEPEEQNPFEGKKVVFIEDENDRMNADGFKGHLEVVGESEYKPSVYSKYVKRGLDIVLSFGGLVVLSPVMGVIALAIKIEDPGPVYFIQKRVGQNKKFFRLHKFRSMKMSTPHGVPTHMMENPDKYITKVGKFLRAHSLDELPQIWDIFVGNMSVIGPRPALWNQELLISERDKYGANDIRPGLTGWAQINGRDELEIPVKAKLDGEYVEKEGLAFDIKVFLNSVHVFGHDDSVVEGGTGKKKAVRHYTDGKSTEELIGHIGFGEPVQIDVETEKRILIIGAGSYIGETFRAYAEKHYPNLTAYAVGTLNGEWKETDFSLYDMVFHVAGIAHADVGNVDVSTKEKYYSVNTDLAMEVAEKAKAAGVKEFIFMSSMIVYGDSAPYGKQKIVDEHTVPAPASFYGDSKLQADVGLRDLADCRFKVIVLRPPMIYGKDSKGNYSVLAKFAKKLPVFPDVDNQRSMLYVENLCEFLCQIMSVKEFQRESVVLIPQNAEWTKTSQMVKEIAEVSGKKGRQSVIIKPVILLGKKMPGQIGRLVNKAFGNNCYRHEISVYEGLDYQKVCLKESIRRTEGAFMEIEAAEKKIQKSMLMLASVASMIDQFNMNNIGILLNLGYKVDIACNFEAGNTCSDERIADLKKRLTELGTDYYQIDFVRNVGNLPQFFKALEQVKDLVRKNSYKFIHCHSPIGGVVGRIVGHECKVKVIYTAHGFHFYDGAPKKNWVIYYPIEKFFSKWTDMLITINKEDFQRARKEFYAGKTVYVPGVGVDLEKFGNHKEIQGGNRIREELGIPEEALFLFAAGELNENKNHKAVIRALREIESKFFFAIAGQGEMRDRLQKVIDECGLSKKVKLLGYRSDIADIYEAADIYVLPSHREGLNVSLMEAMASGLPCACGKIRGNVDLINENGGALFEPDNIEDIKEKLEKLIGKSTEKRKRMGRYNLEKIQKFDRVTVEKAMERVYGETIQNLGGGDGTDWHRTSRKDV